MQREGKKNQQCHHQAKPLKFQAQKAQNSFCSFEWDRKSSNAWKMGQGISIYIHKAKAKEQLLDNGFPATSLGDLKGKDKSKAGSNQLSSCRVRALLLSSAMHYLTSINLVGLMGISWAWKKPGVERSWASGSGNSIHHMYRFLASLQPSFQFSFLLTVDTSASKEKPARCTSEHLAMLQIVISDMASLSY